MLLMVALRNYNLRTSFYDLGQYATILYGYHHSDSSTYLFSTHAQPLIAPLALAYSLFNSPAALQIFSTMVVFGGIYFSVVYLLRDGLERRLGAAIFFASPITWYAVLFDFHFEVFLFCLLPAFFYLSEYAHSKILRGALLALCASLIACIKEPYALLAASLGIWLIVRERNYLLGTAIAAGSTGYFFLATNFFIPEFTENKSTGEIWASAFGHLGGSPLAIIQTVILSPTSIVTSLITPAKIVYVALLIFPFLLTLIRAPSFIIPALPTLLISLISANDNHVGIAHQYAVASWVPLAIGAFFAARSLPPKRGNRALLIVGLVSAATLVAVGPSPFSRLFWNDKVWQYGYSAYIPESRTKIILSAINNYIPANPKTIVSMQNTVQSARLSNRYYAMAFPNGVFTTFRTPLVRSYAGEREAPIWTTVAAEYVLIDLKRPYFIRDQGCEWLWGRCQSQVSETRFLDLVASLSREFEIVFEYDGFRIYRRKHRY
jgi:uncharacterized membrane protein